MLNPYEYKTKRGSLVWNVLVAGCTHGFISGLGLDYICTFAFSALCGIHHSICTGFFYPQRELKHPGIEAAIKRRLMSSLRIFLNIYMTCCFVAATLIMQNVSLHAWSVTLFCLMVLSGAFVGSPMGKLRLNGLSGHIIYSHWIIFMKFGINIGPLVIS
jgi:hypothetical protein